MEGGGKYFFTDHITEARLVWVPSTVNKQLFTILIFCIYHFILENSVVGVWDPYQSLYTAYNRDVSTIVKNKELQNRGDWVFFDTFIFKPKIFNFKRIIEKLIIGFDGFICTFLTSVCHCRLYCFNLAHKQNDKTEFCVSMPWGISLIPKDLLIRT